MEHMTETCDQEQEDVLGPIAQAIQESTIFVCLVGQNVLRNRLLFPLPENHPQMCEPAYSGARLVRDSRRKYVC